MKENIGSAGSGIPRFANPQFSSILCLYHFQLLLHLYQRFLDAHSAFFFLFFAQFLMLALLLCFFLKINIRRKSLNMNWVHMQICWGYQIITWYQKLLAKWQKKRPKNIYFFKKVPNSTVQKQKNQRVSCIYETWAIASPCWNRCLYDFTSIKSRRVMLRILETEKFKDKIYD